MPTTTRPRHAPISANSRFQLQAKDHAEEEAVYRLTQIGPLIAYDKSQGPRKAVEAACAANLSFRPNSETPAKNSIRTIRRWYVAFRQYGLNGLKPTPRKDRGHGRDLPDSLKSILVAIRQEFPAAAAPVILEYLRHSEDVDCNAAAKSLSVATLNRYYRSLDLRRCSSRSATHRGERRKWNAAHPGDIWHADVCHGIDLSVFAGAKKLPLRIHGILDDASRKVIVLSAASDELEITMIDLLIRAIRRFGVPKALYLDNGSTYRGHMLELVCARLGIRLVHAKPYDPEARGKMERFWRTLREQCLMFIGSEKTHDDVQVDLQNFLDHSYHPRAHGSLLGRSPNQVWRTSNLRSVSEDELKVALEVRRPAIVRGDGSVMHESRFFQVPKTFLCGKRGFLVTSLYDASLVEFEFDGRRFPLARVDATHNGVRGRAKMTAGDTALNDVKSIGFDPNVARKNRASSGTQGGDHE